jgi:hypothetical protein
MRQIKNDAGYWLVALIAVIIAAGCTVKAVGDPKRPITIEHHITIDIRGLKDTATDIEDFVSGQKSKEDLSANK